MNSRAAFECEESAKAPTANDVVFCTSGGSAPTSLTPLTESNSLICCTAISASPVISFSAVKPSEFDDYIRSSGKHATLRTILVEHAIDLLKKGDAESHNRLVAARAPELSDCDAILLAHFSTSRAVDAVRAVTPVPVLTAPDAAVARMRELVEQAATAHV